MELSLIYSRALSGVAAPLVEVETHLSNGLPCFHIVGLPETAVRESKDRVRSAILNSHFAFPDRRITVNLAPADLPKEGSHYDLPIAIGLLVASRQMPDGLDDALIVGELGRRRPDDAILAEEGSGGDIVSEDVFGDFELTFEFLLTPVGNSGVFYRVAEDPEKTIWQVAPEYQVLDDTTYIDMGTMDMYTHLTGDNYDLQASSVAASNPIGEWNHGRIVVDGNHVEHWLNGQMTVEYDYFSEEWEALVAASKFAPYAEYGRAPSGRIAIQDHGHELRYRNIKIRPF